MPAIPTMTEITAGVVSNGTNTPKDTSVNHTMSAGHFLFNLMMILALIFISMWIASFCDAFYGAKNEMKQPQELDGREASRNKKQKPVSTQLNEGLISKAEGAKKPLTEDKGEPKNYGTMSKMEAKRNIRAQEDEYEMRSL